MKSRFLQTKQHEASPFVRTMLFLLLPTAFLAFSDPNSYAGSATWKSNPLSSYWSSSSNWTPATVPNGPTDVATFDVSATTLVYPEAFHTLELNSIVFNPGASAFTIASDPGSAAAYVSFTLSGAGIINNSGLTQNFVISGVRYENGGYPNTLFFTNSATAGEFIQLTTYGADDYYQLGGVITFLDTSTAGSSTINNVGGESIYYSGVTGFYDSSSAENATITNNSSTTLAGRSHFYNTSTAGNAIIINNPGPVGVEGGFTGFHDSADAGNSTIICNAGDEGGTLSFSLDSTGGTARVILFGNGQMDIGSHNAPGLRIGSIEGDGLISLGANNLTVGSNDLSTTFSGVIQDGGSFTKIGTGTLTLANGNTYTGGTTIEGGKLVVNNVNGSGTGGGAVQVNAGTLVGRGTIAGAVTVGTGSGAGAVLSPGRRGGKPGNPLTILSTLTCNSDATYKVGLNTKGAIADQVVANGVTINGAFSLLSRGGLTLQAGTVLTVINNTAATPIAGTFANLPDGSTFTTHGNTFQASYEGGDGNDLTLTVVP